MSGDGRSVATKLVEIAEDLFTFGCVTERSATDDARQGAVFEYAAPKGKPSMKRPLPEIRPDLAAVYQAEYEAVPGATALGDAMVVLSGKARQGNQESADTSDLHAFLSMLGGDNTATKLVQLAEAKFSFGITETGEVFAIPIDGPNVARVLRGGRRSLRAELAKLYFAENKTAANAQALTDALLVLEGKAQGVEPSRVALRVGRDPERGRLVLDLGTDDGRAVLIGPDGWELTDRSPVLFWRTNATLPLLVPDESGSVEDLRELLNVDEDSWTLLLAWLVCALIVDLPHPVLLLRGEHGTAKSSAGRLLSSLIDRCASQLRTAPRDITDWAVACAGSWVTVLDNVSHLQPWLQDAMCRAVTGDGLLRRQLYSDSDVSVLAFQRVVAMTSIDPGALGGDLADRMLVVELERIGDDRRTSEADMEARWGTMQAGILGGLLNLTVDVLAALGPIRHRDLPRMADFARIVLAVDEVRGTNENEAYAAQAGRTAQYVAESDPICLALRERITDEWTGTAGELLRLLTPERPPRDWPGTPRGMTGRLDRAAPTLRMLGWTVEQLPRSGRQGSRGWRLIPPEKSGPDEAPAQPSGPSETSEQTPHWADDLAESDGADGADGYAATSSHAEISRHLALAPDSHLPPGEVGPCVRCGTQTHRYGPGGRPRCDECEAAS